MRDVQVDAIIDQIAPLWPIMDADVLGETVRLTFSEKIDLGIRSVRCVDRSPEEVAAWYATQKRARDRERQKRARADKKSQRPPRLSPRAQAVLDALPKDGAEMTVRQIGLAVGARWAFRNGTQILDDAARRQAVHRAVTELRRSGEAETREIKGTRRSNVILIRRAMCGATEIRHCDKATTVTYFRRSTQKELENSGHSTVTDLRRAHTEKIVAQDSSSATDLNRLAIAAPEGRAPMDDDLDIPDFLRRPR